MARHGSSLDRGCAWPNGTTSPVPTGADRSGAHLARLVGSRPNTCQVLSTTRTRSSSRVRARAIRRSSRCGPFRHPRTRRGRRPALLPLPSPFPALPMATVDDIGGPPQTRCRVVSRTSPSTSPRVPRSPNRRTERRTRMTAHRRLASACRTITSLLSRGSFGWCRGARERHRSLSSDWWS